MAQIQRGILNLEAGDKINRAVPSKVHIKNSEFTNIDSYYSSFITILENSELLMENSTVTEVFTLGSGAAICGEYQKTKTEIRNSTFIRNGAISGGAICSKYESKVKVVNSTFMSNFAIQGGVFEVLN